MMPRVDMIAAWPAEHIIGFPLVVPLTLWVTGGALLQLPLPSLRERHGCIGVMMRAADGAPVGGGVGEAPRLPDVDPDDGGPTFSLAEGESRRLLVEVAEVVPSWRAEPSQISVSYHHGPAVAQTALHTLQVRRPNEREGERLAQAGDWQEWLHEPPDHDAALAGPFDGDPLLYHRILRYLMFRQDASPPLDPRLLDALPARFAGEALLLRAELSGTGDLGALAATIDREHPGLRWWLRRLMMRQR